MRDHLVGELPDSFDTGDNSLTGSEKLLRFESHANALRGTGVDDVTRMKFHELADVPNDVMDTKDQIAGRRILSLLTIDGAPESNIVWVE